MYSLMVLGRPTRATAYRGNYTAAAKGWQRSTLAVGGYNLGSFQLSSADLAQQELLDFFANNLGCMVQEYCAGMLSWEGYIVEMRMTIGGVEYSHSLKSEWWHNRVKVIYQTLPGLRVPNMPWGENTDSSDEYGEMNLLLQAGSIGSAGATALQSRHLAEFAWPRAHMVGGLAFGGSERAIEDVLTVAVAGYWHTLNWRYQETSVSDTAHVLIDTLVGASEFVTVGRVEANTLATHVDLGTSNKRLGDLVADVIAQGDASNNIWQGGVYGSRKFRYEPAPTAVGYYLRRGELVDKAGVNVLPPLLEPGFLLYNSDSPMSLQPAGTSNVWDDPALVYVNKVEFVAPDGLRLSLYGEEFGFEMYRGLAGATSGIPGAVAPGARIRPL